MFGNTATPVAVVLYHSDTMRAFGMAIRTITASSVAVYAPLCRTSTLAAAEVAGDLLHRYGRIHVSIDNSDTDGRDDDTCQDGVKVL